MAKYRVELYGTVDVKTTVFVEEENIDAAVNAAKEHAKRWSYCTPVRERGSPTTPDDICHADVYSPYGKKPLNG